MLVTEESFDAQFYVAHNKYYEQVGFMSEFISLDFSTSFILWFPSTHKTTHKLKSIEAAIPTYISALMDVFDCVNRIPK